MTPSLSELITWCEEKFACRQGEFCSTYDCSGDSDKRYVTLGLIGDSKDTVLNALQYDLVTILGEREKPELIWRYTTKIEVEQDEDSKNWKIWTRVFIPGADWSKVRVKPEGEPYVRVS